MKRFTGVRVLCQSMKDSDVGIFIGKGICREAKPYIDRDGTAFFPTEEGFLISFAIGIAMTTDKRIFLFCEDQYFIRNLSEFMQAGVSKCKNLFFVLFVNGRYLDVEGAPTIFDSVNSQHGIFYNLGFLVHDYTKYFNNSRNPIKDIRAIWERTRGPLAILLKTEKGEKKFPDVEELTTASMGRLVDFIRDVDIKAHKYEPPISLDDLNLEE